LTGLTGLIGLMGLIGFMGLLKKGIFSNDTMPPPRPVLVLVLPVANGS
jgi:hypothetical protein